MGSTDDYQGSPKVIFGVAFAAFVGAMVIAHVAAVLAASSDSAHDVFYYLVIFTTWVCIILLTPALCFHIFSRSDAPNRYWRPAWTFAYLALLVHLYWAYAGTCGHSIEAILGDQKAVALHPQCIVDHPYADLLLTAWWGLDVILAWIISGKFKWVRVERDAVHLLAFVMFFGAFVLAPKADIEARLLGILMTLVVLGCFVWRLIVSDNDPKSPLMVLYVGFFKFLNRFVVWHKLPTFLAVGNLGALRVVLRAENLHNTSDIPVTAPNSLRPVVEPDMRYLSEREEDGQYNDLSKPTMGNASWAEPGAAGPDFTLSNPAARFGRNIPLSEVEPTRDGAILDPNPRLISNRLLGRAVNSDGIDEFKPATIVNLLAAAWIQFQVHDWINHGTPRPLDDDPFEVPIPSGDSWPDSKMRVRRTRADPTRRKDDGAGPETFVNAETHWWDGSQLYGDTPGALALYRSGCDGKLKIDPKTKRIPLDAAGIEKTGLTMNWWLGLSLMHNIFTFEHNAICEHLIQAFPEWRTRPNGDEQVFRVARMINNALMAKIHTIEWTTAILTHPAVKIAMAANWWGLAGESVKKYLGRISASEAVSGIPGSVTNQHGADYCLTEEFTAVYRLHPLLPNDIQIISATDGKRGRVLKFDADDLDHPDNILGRYAMDHALHDSNDSLTDIVYTFGVHHPGQITLRNYPNWMRHMRRPDNEGKPEELIDLATIDILRDRERGVPRYNRFRELFHMPKMNSFEEMSDDPELVRALREVYGHPDKVDLMVGMYAEKPPKDFGFSDTAFRVFILMAARRLKSDRFFTNDYTPAVYTKPGLDWIENNSMITVLQRHFPELTPILQRVPNAFSPWPNPPNKIV